MRDRIVVADASTLIGLSRINQLKLLCELFGHVPRQADKEQGSRGARSRGAVVGAILRGRPGVLMS